MYVRSSNSMQQYIQFILESCFRSRILELEHGDICSSLVKFYIVTFEKKSMIHKASLFNDEPLCYLLKTIKSFKLLNEREEGWNNVGKTAEFFPDALVSLLGITKA